MFPAPAGEYRDQLPFPQSPTAVETRAQVASRRRRTVSQPALPSLSPFDSQLAEPQRKNPWRKSPLVRWSCLESGGAPKGPLYTERIYERTIEFEPVL